MVHYILEGGRGVNQAHWYNGKFEKAVFAAERRFPFVPFLYPDQIESRFKVYFGYPFGFSKAVLEFRNKRDRATNWYGFGVGISVVDNYSQRIQWVFFANKY